MKTLKGTLGVIIKNYRKYNELSQGEFAKLINYSQGIVSRMEQGSEIIQLSNYEVALKQLNLYYDLSPEIKNKITNSIGMLNKSFIELDIESIELIINEIEDLMPNIIYYYDLMVCELTLAFIHFDIPECKKILIDIGNNYDILQNKALDLYLFINDMVKRITSKGVIDTTSINITKGLNEFYIGLINFFNYNVSVALENFIEARNIFKEDHNHNRIIRCDIFINYILMKENDYSDIELRCKDLLTNNSIIKIDSLFLKFQYAYSLYYQKKVTEAKDLFSQLKDEEFIYNRFCEYMYNKCLYQLNEIIPNNHFLEQLFLLYITNTRDNTYYSLIEENIIPSLPEYFFLKEYEIYSLDLMNYYYSHRSFNKFKSLVNLLTLVYKV